MKSVLRYSIPGLVLVLIFVVGCSKPPTEELNAAKSAVDAVAPEASKYAAEDVKKLNDDLQAAQNEISAKNYKNAKEILVKVKADAETLKTTLPQRKEQAKNNAIAAQDVAKTAVADAKALLAKAPKGKGSKADIEAMKADIKGLEELLPEVQRLIDTENYAVATEKANAFKEKAAAVSDQINQALEKVGTKPKEVGTKPKTKTFIPLEGC
jgi:hypothetical protein